GPAARGTSLPGEGMMAGAPSPEPGSAAGCARTEGSFAMRIRLTRPEGTAAADLALSRRGLGGLMFMGYAAAALGARAQPVVTPEDGLVTRQVTFAAPDGADLPAYVARPEGAGPFPVVIVASEIFGLHAYIQDVCRRLARQGYAAMAPGYFLRAGDP